jgi:site-specific DNA-methyltransferase (adenine-specific)
MLIFGDCLEEMAKLPAASVDLILCDLPYGTTQNKWDSVIDLKALWLDYHRLCPKGMIVLNCAQPFTSVLIGSNLKAFRHEWVWAKSQASGHLNAKRKPMRNHEDIAVFSYGRGVYNPQGLEPFGKTVRRGNNGTNFGDSGRENFQEFTNYPRTILTFATDGKVHPTQKPVALMEYLIRTYSNEGDVVMDNCFGSCTTGIACLNTDRMFIGIERDPEYFRLGSERFSNTVAQKELFA